VRAMAAPAGGMEALSLQEQLDLKTQQVLEMREKLREVVAAAECSEERMVNKVGSAFWPTADFRHML